MKANSSLERIKSQQDKRIMGYEDILIDLVKKVAQSDRLREKIGPPPPGSLTKESMKREIHDLIGRVTGKDGLSHFSKAFGVSISELAKLESIEDVKSLAAAKSCCCTRPVYQGGPSGHYGTYGHCDGCDGGHSFCPRNQGRRRQGPCRNNSSTGGLFDFLVSPKRGHACATTCG